MYTIHEEERIIKKIIHRKLRGGMTSRDNVLYFGNNIDVRLCPKNGISTLKWALWHTYGLEVSDDPVLAGRCGTKNHRVEQIKKFGYSSEYPYRKDSRRVTVVRDPVNRFLSAAEYLKLQWIQHASLLEGSTLTLKEKEEVYGSLSDLDQLPDSIDEVIEQVKWGEISNSHFWTQATFLGSRGQYNDIWAMSDFPHFMSWLNRNCGAKKPIHRIHANKTSGLYYGDSKDLTKDQLQRIMKIYEEDYDYGWTEENKTKSL